MTFNRYERALFARSFRGKLRLAAAYSAASGLTRDPFAGVADTPIGRFEIDTAHHEDWAMLFGGMEHAQLRWVLAECAGARKAWDVGAHHGFYAVALARVVQEVHAFEPFPESAARTRRNLELNAVHASVHELAVSDAVGVGELLLSVNGPQNHSLVGHKPSGDKLDVTLSTLDTLADQLGVPDFVKMDVEGAEGAAFRGADRLLHKRATVFLFENEPWEESRYEAHRLLRDAGYHLTSLVRGREVPGTDGRMLVARSEQPST